MSGRIDLTLTVPNNINLNFDAPKKPAAATQQRPIQLPRQKMQSNSSPIVDFAVGYLKLLDWKENDPLWRKGVGVIAWGPALPVVGTLFLLDVLGVFKWSARHDDDENIVIEKK